MGLPPLVLVVNPGQHCSEGRSRQFYHPFLWFWLLIFLHVCIYGFRYSSRRTVISVSV
ncbi:hypothetical protein BDP81DRAFT_426932 [Colletotrichum phormii]|uniref:Uncharacterized protein n=1 Tax=Colletotrichum phormii TaxID=359342 RepID=A0AAI9ZV64_9PEZI|nr:uncharacterized protein BDP81DRAFT_426932 [Colletotrichum phormii]KAK1637217.1 hypothetical protein BDP81DRAFT_426932 [Colletotrichum phormii]